MKPSLLTPCFLLALTTSLPAQIPTVDAAAASQRERLHAEQMIQLKTIGRNQRDQLGVLNRQLDELVRLNQTTGDPALVKTLPGIDAVGAPAAPGVAAGTGSSASVSVSVALGDSSGGLFTVIGTRFTTAEGESVAREEQAYKPVAAIVAGRAQFEAVFESVSQRREQLREAARQTLEQLRAATTDAQVQKLQGVLAALHLEIDATDRDLQFSAQRLQAQALDNENDRQRQALARQEEQSAEIRLSLKRMTEGLRPITQPVSLRQTR